MQKEDAACFACGDCSHDCASCTAAGGLSVCELSEWPFPSPPTAVALGFFDGVHSGHRALLRLAAEEAAKSTQPANPEAQPADADPVDRAKIRRLAHQSATFQTFLLGAAPQPDESPTPTE